MLFFLSKISTDVPAVSLKISKNIPVPLPKVSPSANASGFVSEYWFPASL